MDSAVTTGAFVAEIMWCWPTQKFTLKEPAKMNGAHSHIHPFDEVITCFGYDPDNPS
jgi:hypothetical protein